MFLGGNPNRLLGPMPLWITEPNWDWTREAAILARRAQDLVCNDAFSQAAIKSKLDGTHGPSGLKLRSLANLDFDAATSPAERAQRGIIEGLCSDSSDQSFDAAGLLTRKEMERQLDWMATVLGEGFAIRVDQDGRPRATLSNCWRMVRPERISNPDLRPNDDLLFNGMEMGKAGNITAIWVEKYNISSWGISAQKTWQRVPWIAPDGTPNVVRRMGLKIPGMIRGVSMFAPLLLLSKQLRGTVEAHVTGKRAQACTPVIYKVEDPEEAARAAGLDSNAVLGPHSKFEPLQVYYAKSSAEIMFPDFKFNGADMKEFMSFGYRLLCASWQIPVEVALAQMGDASLSSARAGLDQFDRTCQGFQDDHISEVSCFFDEVVIREAVARDLVTPGEAGLKGLLAGRYTRPPKYSTDRLKDALAVKQWIANGRAPTSAFAEYGYDYEDECQEAARDRDFRISLGLPDASAQGTQTAPGASGPPPNAKPDDDDAPGDSGDKKAKPDPDDDDDTDPAEGDDSKPVTPAKGAA